jgi:D-alanyl-D-alanine carboxypeptidase
MPTMNRRTFLVRAAAACAATPVLAACVGEDVTPNATRYETAVGRAMARYRTPGAVASVRFPGDEEWKEGFGYADVASGTPSRPGDYYSIRSITKSFTVTVLLQLVREKATTLDAVLDTFVPGIPNGSRITLADLAGMQSGVANYTSLPAFSEVFARDLTQPFTDAQIVGYAIPASPEFEPGAQYEYSNTNTILLGMAIEKIAGASFASVLQARILGPLKLTGTSYPVKVALPDPHPTPYEVNIASGEPEVLPLINPTALSAAGAMVSTLDDLQTWGRALGDGRLIGAELQAERIARSRVVTNGPTYDRYGLGIGILHGWWGHTGTGLGWQAATFYDPRTQATIAVAVNATPPAGYGDLNLAEEIFKELAAVVQTR